MVKRRMSNFRGQTDMHPHRGGLTSPDRAALYNRYTTPFAFSVAAGSEAPVPRRLRTPLVETATIAGWGLAGQPVKCGGECTRVAEADIQRNCGDGELIIRQ
jgi:hypothetical protein